MKRNDTWIVGALMASAVFASPLAHAADETYLTLSCGFDYSSGKYGGTSTTNTTSIPVSALYETGAWSMRLTVPFLIVSGEGDVVVSGRTGGRRATTTTTLTKTRTTQAGVGDVITLATYNLYMNDEFDTGIDLTGRVKFGTANKAFGSGLNDYSVQMYSYTRVGDFSPSLSLGYEVVGSSSTAPMNNVFFGSVGTRYSLSDQTSLGMDYRYAQKASITGAEQSDATLYVSRQLGEATYLRAYVMQGFADGSADNGAGLSLSATY
jgi:hypothetical protein